MDGEDQTGMPASKGMPEDQISSALKKAYDTVANEPLPDKLNDLLEQLRQGGKK